MNAGAYLRTRWPMINTFSRPSRDSTSTAYPASTAANRMALTNTNDHHRLPRRGRPKVCLPGERLVEEAGRAMRESIRVSLELRRRNLIHRKTRFRIKTPTPTRSTTKGRSARRLEEAVRQSGGGACAYGDAHRSAGKMRGMAARF